VTEVSGLTPLREAIRRQGIDPRRALGQNFLLDPRLTQRVALATGPLEGVNVVEIGPGPGGLTRAILGAGARRVVAVERDERCLPLLHEIAGAYPGRIEIVAADALTLDPVTLVEPPRRILSNLPYNIGTALLLSWLPRIAEWQMLGLMFQKEVAQRITARPGNKSYGRLSVITQWLTLAEMVFDIAPGAFLPPPKVVSTVVRLTPRPEPLAPCRMEDLERVTAAAFGQRRKMLRSSLKSLELSSEALCAAAGIDPTVRAEEVSVEGFCALARAVAAISGR
jgi:16S rRNA (adenine1518-N6/adenine1519-N6)-dimethyltransferase